MSLFPYFFHDYDTQPFIRDWNKDVLQTFLPQSWIYNRHDVGEDKIIYDKRKFQVNFDVQHFKPEEIEVKCVGGNTITIAAEHKEKQDEHGQIYRHFLRKYIIPESYDANQLQSILSSDGVLTISAPKIENKTEYKSIPITQTKQPAKNIEEQKYKKLKSKM